MAGQNDSGVSTPDADCFRAPVDNKNTSSSDRLPGHFLTNSSPMRHTTTSDCNRDAQGAFGAATLLERRVKDSEFVCFQCKRIRPLKSASATFQSAMVNGRFYEGWRNASGPWKTCKACYRAESSRCHKFCVDLERYKRRRQKVIGLLTKGTNLRAKDIPRPLVELKHAQLKLKKICKRQKT